MSNASFRIRKDKAELSKQEVTVTSVTVPIAMFAFGMCDSTLASDVGTGDFSLVLGNLHVRLYIPPSIY